MEVAGLVLGGFSLAVSAMENYGTMERLGRKWKRARQEHDEDVGRIRDCELKYRLHMRALLAPLEFDGIICHDELDVMLADPNSDIWKAQDVDAILTHRLGECKDRYFANLEGLSRKITKLAVASRATDKSFQMGLQKQKKKDLTSASHASGDLMLRANDRLMFELKRLNYATTTFRRDALLTDIETYNTTLNDLLSKQDGLQREELAVQSSVRKISKYRYRTLLTFWKHAECIHHLMQSAWRCTCSSIHCVYLQLDQHNKSTRINLDMLLMYCIDRLSPPVRSWDYLPLSVSHSRESGPIGDHSGSAVTRSTRTVSFQLPNRSTAGRSGTVQAPAMAQGSSNASGSSGTNPASTGLCILAENSQSMRLQDLICTLTDQASQNGYQLIKADMSINDDQVFSLADVLAHRCSPGLRYKSRLTLAYNIACSFLKLYPTPWLHESTLSRNIRLPVSSDGQQLLYQQAFVLANFQTPAIMQQPTDETFASIGILLLELCFNGTLEQHPLWPKDTGTMSVPLVRKAVALAWARDVEEEWSKEGADTIDWCLRLAPSHVDGWREAFATNVVEPLRVTCINSGLKV